MYSLISRRSPIAAARTARTISIWARHRRPVCTYGGATNTITGERFQALVPGPSHRREGVAYVGSSSEVRRPWKGLPEALFAPRPLAVFEFGRSQMFCAQVTRTSVDGGH